MPGPYEAYALATGRLHPDAYACLAPYLLALTPPVRAEDIWIALHETPPLSLGLPNGVAVLGPTIRLRAGVLDADGLVYNALWSWTQPKGLANWAHECFHIHQWLRDGWRLYEHLLWGIFNSCLHGDELYDHEQIPPEMEAIVFERYVESELIKHR